MVTRANLCCVFQEPLVKSLSKIRKLDVVFSIQKNVPLTQNCMFIDVIQKMWCQIHNNNKSAGFFSLLSPAFVSRVPRIP